MSLGIPTDTSVVVIGLGYGDETKGSATDHLAARAAENGRPLSAVVRFNGGAQAAHNVVLPDGRHHTFSMFGSGTLRGVPTFLSRFVLVEPFAVMAEATGLARLGVAEPLALMTVDPDALLTTPFHWLVNRARETARGDGRHGSCGRGIGETVRWSLEHPGLAPRVSDVADRGLLARKLRALRDWAVTVPGVAGAAAPGTPDLFTVRADPHDLVDAYRTFLTRAAVARAGHLQRALDTGPVVFEGAQGVLLDQTHGFHPFTTWSSTTTGNAFELLDGTGHGAFRLGLVRAVTTRHGAGPLVGESPVLSAGWREPHNGTDAWQGSFRVAPFDAVAHRYAVEVSPVDGLAVSHLDLVPADGFDATVAYRTAAGTVTGRLGVGGPVPDRWAQEARTQVLLAATAIPGREQGDPAASVGRLLGVPVVMTAHGPTAADRRVIAAGEPAGRVPAGGPGQQFG